MLPVAITLSLLWYNNGVFPKRFSEFSEFKRQKIDITVKGLEPATTFLKD